MDQQQLQQKIAEYFAKLPADAQAMFANMEWMKTLESLSTKYSLTSTQVENLGTETTLLLLGIIHPNEYTNFLKTDLSISTDTQNKLLADINLTILNKWRDTLEKAYAKNTEDVAEKEYGGETKLDERFSKLPKEVQDAIANSNYQKELYLIASEYKFSIDQMDKLEKATNKILLGIKHPDAYEQMLENDLEIPKQKAIELSEKINEKILKNIRELLKNHVNKNTEPSIPVPNYVEPKIPTPIRPKAPVVTPPIITETPISKTPEPKSILMTNLETGKDDSQILGNSGIEMVKEVTTLPNLPITETAIKKEDTILKDGGVNVLPTNMINDKLSNPVVNVQKSTDQSISRVQNDPYREPVE